MIIDQLGLPEQGIILCCFIFLVPILFVSVYCICDKLGILDKLDILVFGNNEEYKNRKGDDLNV